MELYSAGRTRGILHLYIGEEAVAVGAIRALTPEDAVVAISREHGHALVRHVTAGATMAVLHGRPPLVATIPRSRCWRVTHLGHVVTTGKGALHALQTTSTENLVLDPVLDIPAPARRMAEHIGCVVQVSTAWGAGHPPIETAIRCRRRPGHRACPGRLSTYFDFADDPATVHA